jgi:Family of unknown function (DUF6502)
LILKRALPPLQLRLLDYPIVSSELSDQTARKDLNEIRTVARKSLLQLLEPLVGFVLDSGLSPQDLGSMVREAAVRSVAARQLAAAHQLNISGIAASTGIPRGEISRILKQGSSAALKFTDRHQQSTNRILAVWHQDPKFTTSAGKPADLKIYGRRATFDALVKCHGRGIPTRAVLDELTRAGAAEVLSSNLVRAKSSVAVDRGVTPRAIRAFGERATELLSTMLQNMRDPESARFIANVSDADISSTALPLFRKELATKGADFLVDLQDFLIREESNRPRKRPSSRVSVTIFYHEAPRKITKKRELERRRNFRRQR